MSLLIKALQKAEQSKGAAAADAGASASFSKAAGLELAPHHTDSILPDFREEAGFDEPAAPVATPAPKAAARSAQQEAASTVFSAKQNEPVAGGSRRAIWMGVSGVVFLLLVGGGFYYYLTSLEQPELVVARSAPVAPPPAAAEAPPAAEPVALAQPAGGEIAAASATPAASDAKQHEAPADQALPEKPAPTSPVPVMEPVVAAKPAAAAVVEEAPVRVTRSRTPVAAVNNSVMSGYQAYMAGDDAAAARQYRQALKAEPRNIDALLGLAAVAARQDRSDEATAQYMRVLELEPRNVAAQAGLIALVGQADPVASESRLKSMLAQQPEAAFLHAALGNVYADQNQWPSAQQAYFQAYRYDSDNAEYAFNLAVSLDQMGKSDLALQHYQQALDLLPRQRGTPLDKGQIEARISQLRN